MKKERDHEDSFELLPRHFVETSKVLLDVASDDLAHPGQIRTLLKDLRESRQAKIRIGLQSDGVMRGTYLQVTNLTAMELCEMRPFLVKMMGMMQSLEPEEE